MKNNIIICTIFAMLVILCFGMMGCGDDTTPIAATPTPTGGSISGSVGTVTGANDEPGVLVELTQLSNNSKITTQTDVNGYYIFSNLADGNYNCRFSKNGFVTFNTYTLVSGGLRKAGDAIILTSTEMSNFFGAGHPYNPNYGLIGSWAKVSKFVGLNDLLITCSPGNYQSMGYQISDFSFDWSGTPPANSVGFVMFYNVTAPGTYTLTPTRSGYNFTPTSWPNMTVRAGELTQAEFVATKI